MRIDEKYALVILIIGFLCILSTTILLITGIAEQDSTTFAITLFLFFFGNLIAAIIGIMLILDEKARKKEKIQEEVWI
jgi:hypothetical protein